MIALFGASGDLGQALIPELSKRGKAFDAFSRKPRSECEISLLEFRSNKKYSKYVFTFGKFWVQEFALTEDEVARDILESNFFLITNFLREILYNRRHDISRGKKIDFYVIGSTSAFQGFKNTSLYCASKFALRGLIQSLNDEYSHTNTRFCLYSFGTMKSKMGSKLVEQDASTFLKPSEIASDLADSICRAGQIFEPEVVLRRRHVR